MELAIPGQSNIWRNKSFLVIFLATMLIDFGGKIYELALPLIVYELSRSAVAMSSMRAAEFLPNLCLAFCIGVLVDHVNRRLWAQSMLFAQMALLLGLFAAVKFDLQALWVLYLAGFLLSACNYGYHCARMSLMKDTIVQQWLTPATAKLSTMAAVFDVLGPAVTGLILWAGHLYFGLLVPAVLYLLASALLMVLPAKESRAPALVGFWRRLGEAWIVLRANRSLWEITWFVVVLNSTIGVVEILFLFHLRDTYMSSPAELGWMFSVIGVGAIIGGLFVESLRHAIGLGRVILVTIIVQALAYFGLSFTQNLFGLLSLMFIVSMVSVMQNVCVWGFRQESTATEYIGRISGLTGSIFKLGLPVALVLAGALGDHLGVSRVFFICACINALLVVLFFYTRCVAER